MANERGETGMGEHIGPRLQARDSGGNWRPKRMLALDGGGARGIVTIAFLERIEETLRISLADEIAARGMTPAEFRLCHYFDVIGGTSVGALIATMLSSGMSAREIRDTFRNWSKSIFRPRLAALAGLFRDRHDASALRRCIQQVVGNETLDSAMLKSGLVIITKNARSGSVWVLANNPSARYYNRSPDSPATIPNRKYKLVDLLRASTAAPTFFERQQLEIHAGPSQTEGGDTPDQMAWFVDGGVSPHNNPALQMFMMAGMKGYRFGGTSSGIARRNDEGVAWPLGADNILIVSVGTGRFDTGFKPGWRHWLMPAFVAKDSLQTMISDGQKLALSLLQWFSSPSRSWQIDREIGSLAGEILPTSPEPRALLSFVRYDIELTQQWLDKTENAGRWIAPFHLAEMIDFTSTKSQDRLYEVAGLAAARQVTAADFPSAFNWLWPPKADQSAAAEHEGTA